MTVKRVPQPPPFFAYTPDSLLEAAEHQIAASARVWDRVARIPPHEATFANAIQPLLDDENAASVQGKVLWFLSSAAPPDKDVRTASHRANVRLKQDVIERFTRGDVFAVVDAVAAREALQDWSIDGGGGGGAGDDGSPLTPEARVYLRRLRAQFAENGLAVAAAAGRARLKAVNLRLAEAQTQYLANLNADASGLWLTGRELDGLSPGTLERFPQRREEGEGEEKSYFVNFKRPSVSSVLAHVHNAGVRRRYYIAWDNRLKDKNGPLLREMLRLRREAGRLLGFRNYAESEDHNRMLSTEQAGAFLASLKEPLQELARKEFEELSELKVEHLRNVPLEQKDDSSTPAIFRWDVSYYKNLYKKKKSKVDTEKVSEYFSFTQILPKLMEIFSLLLGLRFVPLSTKTDDIETWHEDVMPFAVWDAESEGGGFVGYLFIDPYPREAKYGHVGQFGLQPGFIQPDGQRRYPSSVLMLNYPPPTPSQPCLLEFREVINCFHELGHSIHWLVSRTACARFHGTQVARDFVEVPSRMLEHFFWDANVIRAVSGHYRDGARLPDDAIARVIAGRFEHAASKALGDLALGTFDLAVHTTWEPGARVTADGGEEADDDDDSNFTDLSALHSKIRREVSLLACVEDLGQVYGLLHGQSHFRAIGGRYGASYYSYLNADTFSTDMFTTKFKSLLTTEPCGGDLEVIVNDDMRAEGRRYRYAVLEPGSSHRSELDLVKAFLGRDPNPKVFVEVLADASSRTQ